MKPCKQIASMGAAATDEADSRVAAMSDAIQSRKGKKAKGKLAVKSNGAEKPKTHDFSDVSRLLGVMNIAEEKSEDESLALFIYQDQFWMQNFKGVYDKPSVDAIRKVAAENWKFFNDSDKAPYVARARINKIFMAEAVAKVHELKKTLKLTHLMTNKMMNLKM
ncbi:DNA-binding protein MNB1B-like [Lolium rigidum]|uniref:DNA-binding protein MNB1B-like n=1 Tax=Lolium rigidum TaxID=89674 RepID=UPI001F5D83C8|nr:DNA-binding protein MNB1B-like [Lolium rigidum]XP_047049222.1 DNA-binding protein MNB1B-like [Lolium rigidum]XP_047049223.1 DNA-binding protein MNB1B-like [Lolium rigidum]